MLLLWILLAALGYIQYVNALIVDILGSMNMTLLSAILGVYQILCKLANRRVQNEKNSNK